jgi:hypothetical protein
MSNFSPKHSELTPLSHYPCRKPARLKGGNLRGGLREVKVARTSEFRRRQASGSLTHYRFMTVKILYETVKILYETVKMMYLGENDVSR